MADYHYSEPDADIAPEAPGSLKAITHVTAAIVSLALIAGVGVWGYKLLVRDVSGIPIVRAAEGEMRVRPEDPGGQLAQHQGLAVNEIAARGQAAGPVEQVMLAPPDVALAPEDQPVVRAAAPAPSTAARPPEIAERNVDLLDGFEVTEAAPEQTTSLSERLQQGAINDVVAELMGETSTGTASATRVDVEGAKTVEARAMETDLIPQPAVLTNEAKPAVAMSIRPKIRPENAASLAQQASFTPTPRTNEIDPSAIPSGTRLAQLGAYESADVARAEWARMEARFGDILADKSRVVEQAQSGGRTFYRLRAMGFIDLADARRFCSAVKAEGVDCIPVQVR